MEGIWDLRVTFRDCQTGAPIRTARAISTFASGGTLMESGAGDAAALRGPGQGSWRHIAGPSYGAVLRFLRLSQDGTFAGVEKVTRTIELSDDGNEFSATACVEVFDTEDSLIQTGCATATARRLQ